MATVEGAPAMITKNKKSVVGDSFLSFVSLQLVTETKLFNYFFTFKVSDSCSAAFCPSHFTALQKPHKWFGFM